MNNKKQKIRVIVADKPYSITVVSQDEEQRVRAATKRIKEKMDQLMKLYQSDMSGYLAMAALEIAIEREELEEKLDYSTDRIHIKELNQEIEKFFASKED
ncbi:MAG: cell division protein ZapA [Rikenellaceae bacterium]